jgi:uncharacterized ParB-like nuclease family protein
MKNEELLLYAMEFEDTSDTDGGFDQAQWHLVDVSVPLLIRQWFELIPSHHKITPKMWWRNCQREDGSSTAMLEELKAGGSLRDPIVITLGGMCMGGQNRFGITDGCHRIVACHLAGVQTIKAVIGVFPDANPDFVVRFGAQPFVKQPHFAARAG